MRLFLTFFFGLLFWQISAQDVSDTKQIFQKIDSLIILNPVRARDLVGYVKKNNQNYEIINRCNRLLVQAYYYENNYNDAFQEIIQTEDYQNANGIIFYRNILYSAGIKKFDFSTNYKQNSLIKLNEEIITANELIIQGARDKALRKISDVLTKVHSENAHTFRDSFSSLLINLDEKSWMSKFPEFRIPVLKILSYYSSDTEFDIFKKKFFPADISDEWLAKTKIQIDNTTNFQLRTIYYNFLQDYYFDREDVSNYVLITDERNEHIAKNNKAIMQARSQWVYLTEVKHNEEYLFAKKRDASGLIGLVFLSCIVLLILVVKVQQEKQKNKRYLLLSNKIKTNSVKKKETQVISENVKLILLERLEKLESKNFFLDPNISIQTLAKKLDSNSKYVSDVINTYKKKNFTAYINEMRIQYIKQKLNNELVYRTYKIKYLAEESGFSSHSVFSSVFKSIEGISPAQYIQLLK
ncbi:helix-turn-helix domain-containing protein [Chryseobacterium indoltheticum]|uniref:helix-turn-helix domain-containing protein n=1 Tax=Chryseobacterium indoltheticum TaxID=254 RepID=UPI0028E37465|nr:helix-turn-helix domain-containing protein [Chryseobacterium indoltheticum]